MTKKKDQGESVEIHVTVVVEATLYEDGTYKLGEASMYTSECNPWDTFWYPDRDEWGEGSRNYDAWGAAEKKVKAMIEEEP